MNSRQRVHAAITHQPPDRTPVDINLTLAAYDRLTDHLGVEYGNRPAPSLAMEVNPPPELLAELGVDAIAVKFGEPRTWDGELPPRKRDAWGIEYRLIEQAAGAYYEADTHPLADATLDNYRCTLPGQSRVVGAVQDYADNMLAEVAAGAGVVLFGPTGGGKDHLLTALGKIAIGKYGLSVLWADGMELFGEVRDRIANNEAEKGWVRELIKPEILYLSDPTPPKGELSTHQSAMLGRVLDRRNRDKRPTWVSMNVRHSSEADAIMGAKLVDRLKDGVVAAFCDWASNRKSRLVWPEVEKRG